jgi:hypothetical protein
MVSIAQLRSQLRAIRKRIADKVGYQDFKYLHKLKRPELEALLKKYEKFETQVVGTIQNAIRNKRARNTAENLLREREVAQNVRDLEMRIAFDQPVSLSAVISDVGLSSARKSASIRELYKTPSPPAIPRPDQAFVRRSVEEGRVVPLPRVKKQIRPTTSVPVPAGIQRLSAPKNIPPVRRPLSAPVSRLSPRLSAPSEIAPVNFRQRLAMFENPVSSNSSGRTSGLSQVETRPRPESAGRSFNKFNRL